MDGRGPAELRPVRIHRGFAGKAAGSCLLEMGGTKVLCAVTMEEKAPPFLKGSGSGWVTAEYFLLPASTGERTPRQSLSSGRTHEIQRLIGRSLRAVVDLKRLGERTFWVDCDVIQADGGTRTASVTGAFIALADAVAKARAAGAVKVPVFRDYLAAVSAGIVGGRPLLDLDYPEDSAASVDFNVVMTGRGEFVEVQGTGEGACFGRDDLDAILALAREGVGRLVALQKETLKDVSPGLFGQ